MSNGSGKYVLIVDDSASIRREVKAILQKEGYTVWEAGNESGMFNSVEQYGQVADIILMDLMLNGAYGFDLIAKLRDVDRFKDIPVIMLTQHSDKESVSLAKLVGVQGYIVKPINAALLIERVKKGIDDSNAIKQK